MTQTVETVIRQERVQNTKPRQAIERLQQLFFSNEKLRIEDLKGVYRRPIIFKLLDN
jgi:hypothetical protein